MYNLKPVSFDKPVDDWLKDQDDNMKTVENHDKEAKEKGLLIGRFLSHPMADGQAFYQITKENKTTVRIKVLTGLGDDWVLPAWGEEASVNKELALQMLNGRDRLAELFGGK